MNLHENRELFKNAIIATAQYKNIREIYVEKDYWVTLALNLIFKSEIGNETIFKGGTSLSKCYGLINRFSEDIDLVVSQTEDENPSELKKKLKTISKCIENTIPEILIEGITNKRGRIRKTAHSYSKVFSGDFGQIKDSIIVEVTSFGNPEFYEMKNVSSLIYEMMFQKEQSEIINKYNLNPFQVRVLHPQRTLCEKIMSLVRFSYADNPINDLRNKVRHIYDIHIMLKEQEINKFFSSSGFDVMMLRVANDDIFSFKNNNEYLLEHPVHSLIFLNTKGIWDKIKNVYSSTFKELVFDHLPDEKEILNTLINVSTRLKPIQWSINRQNIKNLTIMKQTDNFKRTLVTTALPYANGPVHVGHLAGVYVPADIYVRYLRLKREDVILIGGSDEHGVPITLKAKNEGVTPQDIVDKFHGIIKKSFEEFGITFDIYSRTTNKTHYETASEFFKTLYDKGEFIEKVTDQYYDEEAGQFLADRYITGTCPHCKSEGAYGDQCESCGTSLNATDLINPKSVISGGKLVLKETKHWYLPLDKHEPFLKKWILEEHKEWKPNVYGQCKSWLDMGLQPRAVSRDLNWGVPLPIDGADGKVLYVWFDAPIGYISATKELTPDWEKYWKDPESRMVHFIGKDNIVFHCIVFPAMLKAEGSYILPDNVPSNEFLNLEGDKISTSRNWAVWLHEYLVDFKDKQDVLRYVLTANAPETKDNDFTWKDFQARNNNELVAILGNFVNRALVLTQKYYNGAVPALGELTVYDKETLAEIPAIVKRVEHALDHYKFREAIKEAMSLARLGNKYLADSEPWKLIKTDEERVKTVMNIALQITANLSILMEPFLPFTTKKMQEMLNLKNLEWDACGKTDLLPAGHLTNNPELLFEKIEDDAIQAQLDKLAKTKEDNDAANKVVTPAKEDVSFDDFTKLDIRVGTIVEAEKVAKTKKLMKLVVDTGIDKRTVVSGIAEFFTPEKVVGKQVSILVNLAPRKIRGIESQGMILMAEDATGELSFVMPDKNVKPGSEIR